jgi:hypothetical protein
VDPITRESPLATPPPLLPPPLLKPPPLKPLPPKDVTDVGSEDFGRSPQCSWPCRWA